jgi:hypothetical protein
VRNTTQCVSDGREQCAPTYTTYDMVSKCFRGRSKTLRKHPENMGLKRFRARKRLRPMFSRCFRGVFEVRSKTIRKHVVHIEHITRPIIFSRRWPLSPAAVASICWQSETARKRNGHSCPSLCTGTKTICMCVLVCVRVYV